jgi:Fe-S cluster biosynthesis and repair protein YggX
MVILINYSKGKGLACTDYSTLFVVFLTKYVLRRILSNWQWYRWNHHVTLLITFRQLELRNHSTTTTYTYSQHLKERNRHNLKLEGRWRDSRRSWVPGIFFLFFVFLKTFTNVYLQSDVYGMGATTTKWPWRPMKDGNDDNGPKRHRLVSFKP